MHSDSYGFFEVAIGHSEDKEHERDGPVVNVQARAPIQYSIERINYAQREKSLISLFVIP